MQSRSSAFLAQSRVLLHQQNPQAGATPPFLLLLRRFNPQIRRSVPTVKLARQQSRRRRRRGEQLSRWPCVWRANFSSSSAASFFHLGALIGLLLCGSGHLRQGTRLEMGGHTRAMASHSPEDRTRNLERDRGKANENAFFFLFARRLSCNATTELKLLR